MKQKTKRAFDSVSELVADPGLIGMAIKNLPKELLQEADTQRETWGIIHDYEKEQTAADSSGRDTP